MSSRLVVLDGHACNPGDLSWALLEPFGKLEVHARTAKPDIIPRALDADIVLTNKTPLDAETIASLPRLKAISVLATGYNVVDVKAARARDVPVFNVPAYATDSVAQHTFGLLLELTSRVGLHEAAVRRGDWARAEDFCFWQAPLSEVAGKQLGIIGFGTIGRRVAELALAFGMRVVAARGRSAPPNVPNVTFQELDSVLASSDVVSLHCPLTEATQGLIDLERLRRMKRSAILLNTSRGPLVVEADLAQALREGTIAAAGLDVLCKEPPRSDHPLVGLPNCIITPHIAWASREARGRLLAETAANLAAFLAGTPKNVVNGA